MSIDHNPPLSDERMRRDHLEAIADRGFEDLYAAEYDRWLSAHDERVFRAAWERSGEGCNGEYPDEGVPWEQSAGYAAFAQWMSDPQRRNGE